MNDDTPRSTLGWGGFFAALLTLIILLALTAAAVIFALYLTGTQTNVIAVSPSPAVETAVHTAPAHTATPTPLRVCTDIPDGRLHVRFAAGDGSEVRGYLAEGESVLPTANIEILKGETWQQITSPIAGWVNARYLCPSE
jgi:hypothetical protein